MGVGEVHLPSGPFSKVCFNQFSAASPLTPWPGQNRAQPSIEDGLLKHCANRSPTGWKAAMFVSPSAYLLVWEGLTLWEVGFTNPDFNRRCQQDRRVEKSVVIFLIMHDSFLLVGINAAISSWARWFFKKEKKGKMQRMKERHREKEKTPRKRSEKEQRTSGVYRIFFCPDRVWNFQVAETESVMSQSPQEVKAVVRGSRRRAEQRLTFISHSKPCLRTGWCRLGTPSLELYGVCVSPFWAKPIKDHDVCLFVFKYFCIELNFTLSVPNSLLRFIWES